VNDIIAGVYYRPPDQEEEVDEAFYRQLKVASQSQVLTLVGDSTTLTTSRRTIEPGTVLRLALRNPRPWR